MSILKEERKGPLIERLVWIQGTQIGVSVASLQVYASRSGAWAKEPVINHGGMIWSITAQQYKGGLVRSSSSRVMLGMAESLYCSGRLHSQAHLSKEPNHQCTITVVRKLTIYRNWYGTNCISTRQPFDCTNTSPLVYNSQYQGL